MLLQLGSSSVRVILQTSNERKARGKQQIKTPFNPSIKSSPLLSVLVIEGLSDLSASHQGLCAGLMQEVLENAAS